MYQKFGIKKEILDLSEEVEKEIQPIFKNIEKIEEINSLKVLSAFQECGLSEMHLHSSTGYGIDEIGRNKIEEIYAKIFNAEDALVRAQLISGTHALAVTLFGILRPGDTMLSFIVFPITYISYFILLAFSTTSSIVPANKNADSGKSSYFPDKISLNPLTVSLTGTYLPCIPVNCSATVNG